VWREHRSKYELLFDLVKAILAVPYSSCNIERIFSKYADNRLSKESLEACLLVKEEFSAFPLSFKSEMLEKYKGFIRKMNLKEVSKPPLDLTSGNN